MKTSIIKTTQKSSLSQTKKVNDQCNFKVQVPVQNIGSGYEILSGTIVKVNRVTVHVLDSNGNTWKVNNSDLV
jgi:hypothetical protein